MSKQFEELSKNLASGMSRRKAFGRFFTGMGVALGGLILQRPARADDGVDEFCVIFCTDVLHLEGRLLTTCITDCERALSVNR